MTRPAEKESPRCEDYCERDCPRYCGEDGCWLAAETAASETDHERGLRLARERAHHPDDEEMRHAARQFIGTHFGGCADRTAAFFDEFARPTPPAGPCQECGGAGLAWESDEGGGHPVHCSKGCDIPPGEDHE